MASKGCRDTEDHQVTSPKEEQAPREGDQPCDGPQEEGTLAAEVAKVLQVRRWREREGPFRGFDSPPGRF